MKYLKLYENFNIKNLIELIKEKYGKNYDPSHVNSMECYEENLTSLDGIEIFTNIERLNCSYNELTSLKEIENLKKLTNIRCNNNKLESLDGIENLPNLKFITAFNNPIKYPTKLPKEISIDLYDKVLMEKFKTYEFQKEFLTKFPDKIEALRPFGFDKKIKEEFAYLIRGSEWGFFDLERSEK